ncbi:CPBP family intramembrane metalloprotease [Candidatus Bathyarchaeota archaeon]|nr:CPBP family intramembrane metalloprotease [Candidatus Bathyarchaeota archaeon]MBS7628974.1 CPBP family intramembrane metalloprotease [Candidatus Bathyarchaeota archaeon]
MCKVRVFIQVLGYIWRAVVVFLVSTYILSMILGMYFMLIHPDGYRFSSKSAENLPVGFVALFVFKIPTSIPFGLIFTSTWIFYALCFTLAWMDGIGFHSSIKGVSNLNPISRNSNFLYAFPAVSSILLIAVTVIQNLQETAGVSTGSIEFEDLYRGLFNLAYSPIFEEFMYRISPFAVYSIFRLALRGDVLKQMGLRSILKLSLRLILHPDRAKESLGWPSIIRDGFLRGISVGEWFLISSTSTVFGLAHYFSGSGWEIGKISTSFLAGLIFFIMYLASGFYAPVLLHWFFNYYFHVYTIAIENYDGPLIFLGEAINTLLEATGFTVGILILVMYVRRLLGRC